MKLREFRPGDAERLYEIESQEEVVRYQDFGPRSHEESEDYVRQVIESSRERPRTGYEYAITLDDDVFIGRVGALVCGGSAALWYVVDPGFQGRGYATAAIRELMDLLRKEGVREFKIECDPRNEPSWRLAERLGFELIFESDGGYVSKGVDCGTKLYRKA